jgi:eukaryotic-like serine/threonine-protein kinase
VALSVGPNAELESVLEARPGLVVGTPGYMSPEQARGDTDIDLRSDLYSVGVMLYEALVGTCPHDGASLEETLQQITSVEPPALRDLLPSINPMLSDFVAQAMAKDRERRFASAHSMRAALLVIANAIWPEQTSKSISLPPFRIGRSPDSLAPPGGPSDAQLEADLLQLRSSMPAADSSAEPVATSPDTQAASGPRRSLVLPLACSLALCVALTWLSRNAVAPAIVARARPTLSAPPTIVPTQLGVPAQPPPPEVHPPLDRSLWDPAYLAAEDAGVDADPEDDAKRPVSPSQRE